MRLAAAVLGIVVIAAGSRVVGQDAGAIGVPVDLAITFDEAAIGPHRAVDLELVMTAEADLEQIRVRASAVGDVEIVMPLDSTMPELRKGEVVTFGVPVRYGAPGESSVHFDVEAVIAKVDFRFGDRATLNALVRADRAFAGPDAPVNLQRRAQAYDRSVDRLRWTATVVIAVVGVSLVIVTLRKRRRGSGA